MNSVPVCALLLLAFAQCGYAVNVCGNDVFYSSALTATCEGTDRRVLWPQYSDFTAFYQCYDDTAVLKHCPKNTYFTYYYQKCTSCSEFLPPPKCEVLQEKTNVICTDDSRPTTVTKPTKGTTIAGETTVTTPKTSTTKRRPMVPTPPSTGTTAEIPMPPMIVTPRPGIPTPPNENVTPPSIPGTPPYQVPVASA